MQRLYEVHSSAYDLLSALGNPGNIEKAKDVSVVFKEYERRLRALGLEPDGAGLTNAERDLIRAIFKKATNALNCLQAAGENASLALNRAYANGEGIETDVRALHGSLQQRPVSHVESGHTHAHNNGTGRSSSKPSVTDERS